MSNKFARISIKKLINEKLISIDEQLIRDDILKGLNNQHMKFYHGRISRHNCERLLLDYKKDSEGCGLFLVSDDTEHPNVNNYTLTVLYDRKLYHFKVEHVEDAYFRLPDESIVHGLDTMIEILSLNKKFLPCKLKTFVQGKLPPDSSLKVGYTNLLHKIVSESSAVLLEKIIKNENCPPINVKDSEGSTALHIAIKYGNMDIVEVLLYNSANIHIRDRDGNNALHLCCKYNQIEIFKHLVQTTNCNLNDRNPETLWTLLHTAAYYNSIDVVYSLLIDHGALLNTLSVNNETPEDLARSNNSMDSFKLLKMVESGKITASSEDDWLHDSLTYLEAVALMCSMDPLDGLFMIIKSEKQPTNFNMFLFYEENLKNFEICNTNGKYHIGMGPLFRNLEQLVDFYCRNKLDLPCTLKMSLNKKGDLVTELMKKLSLRRFINLPRASNYDHESPNAYTDYYDDDDEDGEDDQNYQQYSKNLNRTSNTKMLSKYPSSLSDTKLNSIRTTRRTYEWHKLKTPICHTPINCDTFKSNKFAESSWFSDLIHSGKYFGKENFFAGRNQNSSSSCSSQELKSIPANRIRIKDRIGEGEFGYVYEGNLTKRSGSSERVALKKLKVGGNLDDFLKEAKILCSLDHPCIVKVYGVCYEFKIIAMELVKLGSLNKYLRNNSAKLEVETLKLWSFQIADGMAYLELNKLVHRDLASRNVLVSSVNQIKISDFGMTRKLESFEIYLQNPRTKIPFRWYPLESVEKQEFTGKSDVWSYGITVWEIFSLGETPYHKMNFSQVVNFLKQGMRLNKPSLCSQLLYSLLNRCWNTIPDYRPSFFEIVKYFNKNYELI